MSTLIPIQSDRSSTMDIKARLIFDLQAVQSQ